MLRRLRRLTFLFGVIVTSMSAFLFVMLIPETERSLWAELPLAGIAQHLAGSERLKDLGAFALVCAAFLLLVPTAQAALDDLEHMVQRGSIEGLLPGGLAALHTRFGTPARAVDISVVSTVLAIVVGGGRVTWLALAYAIGVAVMLVLRIAVLLRKRRTPSVERPYTASLNLKVGRQTLPVGLIAVATIVGVSAFVTAAVGDGPSVAAVVLIAALTASLAVISRQPASASIESDETFDLLPSPRRFARPDRRASGQRAGARSAIRMRSAHVVAALQTAGDRDVVVMTVRLLGVDVSDENGQRRARRRRTSAACSPDVVALAERHRPAGAAADRPGPQRRRRHRRHRRCACARPRSTSASRPRCRPPTRRACWARRGNAPTSRSRSTSGWSSITGAGAPTPTISAPTRRRSPPAISI